MICSWESSFANDPDDCLPGDRAFMANFVSGSPTT